MADDEQIPPVTYDIERPGEEVVPSLVTLMRSVPDATAASVGTWTVGDVAAHLSHVFRFDTNAIAGNPVPDAIVTTAGMAEVNATMLAEDGERDPATLADRIDTLAALPPTTFVNQEKASSFRARFDLRLRGGGRTLMAFDGGSLTLESGGACDVDAHIRADPAALMLVFIGREELWKPLLGGKLAAWGLRPWKLAGMLSAISPP